MSALNVTRVLIFVVVVFAVVTQLLAASGAISLSTTLQLTMWLVVLGFIVLLAIAYMFFGAFERVFETATRSRERPARDTETIRVPASVPDANGQRDKTFEPRAPAARKRNDAQERARPGQDARSRRNPADGPPRFIPGWSPDGSALEAEDAWVPPDEFRHLEGSEYSVSTAEVFPDGCYLEPDSITLVSDKPTGQQVYECRVVDRNSALKDRPHETVVKILADRMPDPPTGTPFEMVEFERLTITPYVTDQNPMRIRYWLRATGLHPATTLTVRESATWTTPPPKDLPPEVADADGSTEDASSGTADRS